MDYYAYEYEVLMKLQDKYKIKSITLKSREYCMDIVKLGDESTIIFDFSDDFHIAMDRAMTIQKAFELGCSTDKVVFEIGNHICNSWVSRILK